MSALSEKDVSRRLPVPDRALSATRDPPWSYRIVESFPESRHQFTYLREQRQGRRQTNEGDWTHQGSTRFPIFPR
jgi:hypothetical protein